MNWYIVPLFLFGFCGAAYFLLMRIDKREQRAFKAYCEWQDENRRLLRGLKR